MRLEFAIRADRVLNDMLDRYEEEFDRRVAAGLPYELAEYDAWVANEVAGYLTSGA